MTYERYDGGHLDYDNLKDKYNRIVKKHKSNNPNLKVSETKGANALKTLFKNEDNKVDFAVTIVRVRFGWSLFDEKY